MVNITVFIYSLVIGTELCTVVETMYSYEILFSVTGDTVFGEFVV